MSEMRSETREETFEVERGSSLELRSLPSGHAVFLPGEEGRVEVQVRGRNAGEFRIEDLGDRIFIGAPEGGGYRWGSHEVTVRMPQGVSLSVNTASAGVDVEVEVGDLGVDTSSGNVRGGVVRGDVGANTASGDIRFESIGGDFGANTASGDIYAGEVGGDVGINTASGDARLGAVHSDLGVQSASGDIEVESYLGDDLECNTQSGDVKISLPPGRTLNVDLDTLSGGISSELDEDSEGEEGDETVPDAPEDSGAKIATLRARTVSGNITLARAR